MAVLTAPSPIGPDIRRWFGPNESQTPLPTQPETSPPSGDVSGNHELRFQAIARHLRQDKPADALGDAAAALADDLLATAPPTSPPEVPDPDGDDGFRTTLRTATLLMDFCQTLGLDRTVTRQILIGALLRGAARPPRAALPDRGAQASGSNAPAADRRQTHDVMESIAAAPWLSPIAREIVIRQPTAGCAGGNPSAAADAPFPSYRQMAAIVGAYATLTRPRAGRRAVPPGAALRLLASWGGSHFDERLTRQFIRSVGIYPLRTLLRLEGEMLGIVMAQNPDELLRPVVRVVYDVRRYCRISPRDLDLAASRRWGVQCVEHPGQWNIRIGQYLYG